MGINVSIELGRKGNRYIYVSNKRKEGLLRKVGNISRTTTRQPGGTVHAVSCTVPIFVPFRLFNVPVFVVLSDVCNCTVPYIPRTVAAYAVRDPA